jgi:hypothetical protein
MKKLDRILKNLNLFDVLVITTILIGIVILAFFLLRRTKYLTVVIKLTNKNILNAYGNPPTWFAEYFKEGMAAKDSLGRKTAEIKQVYRYDSGTTTKALYLTMSLKADYSWGSGKYSYEGAPLILGAPIKIELQQILIEGLVTYIEGVPDNRVDKEMLVETQLMDYQSVFPETNGLPQFKADAINIGDQVKDSLGNVLITVAAKRVEPAKKIVTTTNGNLLVQSDPLKKDIYLTLKIKVKEINNTVNTTEYYIVDDVRIKIGDSIPLHLKNISVYPLVTKIVEVKD